MEISSRKMDKTVIVDLSGDIDLGNTPAVRKAFLREVKENRVPRVVINLSKVRYIDSSGVASLVEALKASRDVGSRLILIGFRTSVREGFPLSRLPEIFENYD